MRLTSRSPCATSRLLLRSLRARAAAASSVRRTTTRSGMRRSMARTSFSRIFWSRSSSTSRCERLVGALLRQAHVDAIVELEGPAPRPRPASRRGCGLRAGRRRRCSAGYSAALVVGVLADHERQPGEALVAHAVDHGAVGGDDEELAVFCQSAKGSRSTSVIDELVGVELADGGAADQRHGLEPLARTSPTSRNGSETRGDRCRRRASTSRS